MYVYSDNPISVNDMYCIGPKVNSQLVNLSQLYTSYMLSSNIIELHLQNHP